MKEPRPLASPIRFGVYEVELVSGELKSFSLSPHAPRAGRGPAEGVS
jgi:hypothetical protein